MSLARQVSPVGPVGHVGYMRRMFRWLTVAAAFVLVLSLVPVRPVLAATSYPDVACKGYANIPGCTCTGPNGDVPSVGCFAGVVVNVINTALIFLGAVTLIFLLVGALRLVVSRGDPKALEAAQKTMTFAVVGVILVLGSFIIINIITSSLGLGNILTNFTVYQ